MTSTNLTYILNAIAVLFFLVPAWEIVFRRAKGIKRITKTGWVMFATAILFYLISYLNIKTLNKEKEKSDKLLDSAIKANKNEVLKNIDSALKNSHLTYNDNTKKITRTNLSKDIDPVLDLVASENNPLTTVSKNLDTIGYKLFVQCINKGIAYNINDTRFFFFAKNMLSITNKQETKRSIPESFMIHGDMSVYLSDKFNLIRMNNQSSNIDTTYLYLKIDYTNKQFSGKKMIPLRKIFSLQLRNNALVRQNISDFQQVKDFEYTKVKKLLIKYKFW